MDPLLVHKLGHATQNTLILIQSLPLSLLSLSLKRSMPITCLNLAKDLQWSKSWNRWCNSCGTQVFYVVFPKMQVLETWNVHGTMPTASSELVGVYNSGPILNTHFIKNCSSLTMHLQAGPQCFWKGCCPFCPQIATIKMKILQKNHHEPA